MTHAKREDVYSEPFGPEKELEQRLLEKLVELKGIPADQLGADS